jgi:deazaflavin-dependent oxidoreductase (nitroreductase family)
VSHKFANTSPIIGTTKKFTESEMSDATPGQMIAQGMTPEEMIAQGQASVRQHRDEYIRTKGAKGHIKSMTREEGYEFSTHCLLRTIGRKSGKAYINPLYYTIYRDEIVVLGSAAGSEEDPGWSKNLRARQEAQVQIGGQAFQVSWRVAEKEERQRIWNFVVTTRPPFDEYQARTERQIPVILLHAIREIPIFTEADYD